MAVAYLEPGAMGLVEEPVSFLELALVLSERGFDLVEARLDYAVAGPLLDERTSLLERGLGAVEALVHAQGVGELAPGARPQVEQEGGAVDGWRDPIGDLLRGLCKGEHLPRVSVAQIEAHREADLDVLPAADRLPLPPSEAVETLGVLADALQSALDLLPVLAQTGGEAAGVPPSPVDRRAVGLPGRRTGPPLRHQHPGRHDRPQARPALGATGDEMADDATNSLRLQPPGEKGCEITLSDMGHSPLLHPPRGCPMPAYCLTIRKHAARAPAPGPAGPRQAGARSHQCPPLGSIPQEESAVAAAEGRPFGSIIPE